MFCTQNCLARRHGMLQARSTTPTAEWTRSHCLCCKGRKHPPQRRRKAVLNFDDGVVDGSAFTGLLASSGNRGFHPNSDRFTTLVDSGASDHLIDKELIPRRRKSMRDYSKLKDPKTITTNWNKKVFATATGTIWGYIIGQAGKRVPVRISATFVPGLGRHVFSSTKAMQSGVSIILETGSPHLPFDSSTSLPLTRDPEDKGICSYDVFVRTLGGTADTSSTPAVVPAIQASNDANRGVCTFKEIQEFCTNSSIATEHTTTVAPQLKRVSARYGENHATQKECTLTGGKNTPEEAAVTETERQHAQIPDITPEKAIVTETERFCALAKVMLHYYENNLLEEEKSSTTAGASSTGAGASSSEESSSSPEVGEWSSRAGALPQDVGVPLTGITPANTPGDAHSTTTGAAPDVRHYETASTRPNPSVDDTFDNTHKAGASGTTPSTTCVNFTCTERNPFRISEQENRPIKISNNMLRCHPLRRSASREITGTGIIRAGIIEVAGSSPSGTTGPSAEPRVDGSTMSATPGITPAFFEPSLGTKLNNETDRQEEVHTLTTTKGQPRANPETGSAESTQGDQEPLANLRPSCTSASQPQASSPS